MTDIALTAAQVALIDPLKADIKSYIAYEALTRGDAVYIKTDGTVAKADANGSGTLQFRGIALESVGAGAAVDVLHEGLIAGFTVSGMNADAIAYLSNTAGKLATAAGSTSVACGRVLCMTDQPTATKVLRIFTQWEADWA